MHQPARTGKAMSRCLHVPSILQSTCTYHSLPAPQMLLPRVHYTLRMYYAAQQANEILNLAVSSLPANVSRIYASLVGTAVTYCIFAGIIMGLGVWKGWTDSDQDLQGEAHGREGGFAGRARGKGGNRVALVGGSVQKASPTLQTASPTSFWHDGGYRLDAVHEALDALKPNACSMTHR